MNIYQTGYVPEQCCNSLSKWRDLKDVCISSQYNEHDQISATDKPVVVEWTALSPRVRDAKRKRDKLREQGATFYPWKIAEKFGIAFEDQNQGNLGSCASFGTTSAIRAKVLDQMVFGYKQQYKEFNPYYTWIIGKRDANYRGDGATLSMMLSSANKRGMFPVEKVGRYEDTAGSNLTYSDELLGLSEKFQVGACYLGDYVGEDLARIVFDCLAAGFPICFGNSVAVSSQTRMVGNIKTAINSGSWMHATARIAYRIEDDGTEYIAHQGSWGPYWERSPEGEPASVIWESFDTFADQCSGRYADAFAITLVEGIEKEDASSSFAPVLV